MNYFSPHDVLEHFHLTSLPRWKRLAHPKTRRHLLGFLIGFAIMLCGSNTALHATTLSERTGVPHLFIDCFGYFIHAVGGLPILRHFEPLFNILSPE